MSMQETTEFQDGLIDASEDEETRIMREKVADLERELRMSPTKFEDKLLGKLREEIESSKE